MGRRGPGMAPRELPTDRDEGATEQTESVREKIERRRFRAHSPTCGGQLRNDLAVQSRELFRAWLRALKESVTAAMIAAYEVDHE